MASAADHSPWHADSCYYYCYCCYSDCNYYCCCRCQCYCDSTPRATVAPADPVALPAARPLAFAVAAVDSYTSTWAWNTQWRVQHCRVNRYARAAYYWDDGDLLNCCCRSNYRGYSVAAAGCRYCCCCYARTNWTLPSSRRRSASRDAEACL